MRSLVAFAVACACAGATPEPGWILARSAHFEVYSQGGEASARDALVWFEQLRAFFSTQTKLGLDSRPPVRIVAFSSADEYKQYSIQSTSDAFYVGTESRDYIVMSNLAADQFRVAAHEYAHVIFHAGGLHFPSWFSEGLAEVLSSVRMGGEMSTIGGDLPARSRYLIRPWIPLDELFSITNDSPERKDRNTAALFYAESWALVHMLLLSPDYGPRFSALMTALSAGTPATQALTTTYRRQLTTIARDAHAWIKTGHFTPVRLPGVAMPDVGVEVTTVSPFDSHLLLAELLFASGDLDRAEASYRDLGRQAPNVAAIPAALGTIALRKGDRNSARDEWRRAMDLGIDDPSLCFRYALLAQEAGLDTGEIRRALERAIALRPDFDDARYTLALLEMNHQHFDECVTQLRGMKNIAPERAYGYWSALSYSLVELDRRAEAKTAAAQAARYAGTPEDRAHASSLAYMADTDFTVRFTRDANGRPQLTTARAPHNETNWNPFIEPGDRIRRVDAMLDEIRCDGSVTRIDVTTSQGRLVLLIPDPTHVQMRNAPPDFVCGPQSPRAVTVEYAATDSTKGSAGVVRGIEFRSSPTGTPAR